MPYQDPMPRRPTLSNSPVISRERNLRLALPTDTRRRDSTGKSGVVLCTARELKQGRFPRPGVVSCYFRALSFLSHSIDVRRGRFCFQAPLHVTDWAAPARTPATAAPARKQLVSIHLHSLAVCTVSSGRSSPLAPTEERKIPFSERKPRTRVSNRDDRPAASFFLATLGSYTTDI